MYRNFKVTRLVIPIRHRRRGISAGIVNIAEILHFALKYALRLTSGLRSG